MLVFPLTVTVTAVVVAVPFTSCGTTAEHCVALQEVPFTLMAKKLNVVCPAVVLNPVPVTVTVVPAAAGFGLMLAMVGNTSKVNVPAEGALVTSSTVATSGRSPPNPSGYLPSRKLGQRRRLPSLACSRTGRSCRWRDLLQKFQ